MQSFTRLASFGLVPLLFSACTDDATTGPIQNPPTEDPTTQVASGNDIGGGIRGDVEPTSRCVPVNASAMHGTSDDDDLRDVIVTDAGQVLVVGQENTGNGSRGKVLQFAGSFRSIATLDTLGSDSFDSIAIDRDTGKIWLAATTSGALPDFPSHGDTDVMLGELARTGFKPLARGFGFEHEFAKQLAARDGYVAIAGYEQRRVDNSTLVEPLLATYNTAGAAQWYTTRRTTDLERFNAVDIGSGSIAVGGATASGASAGAFVKLYSTDADILWLRNLSTVGSDEIAAVHVLPNGDVLWAGTTSAQLGEAAYGGKDVVVGRLDGATGESIWTTQLGTDADEHVADLALEDDGTIHILGDVTEADSTDRDVFLFALADDGTVRSQDQWGSTGDDVPTALALDSCGTAIVVGHTTGDLAGPSHGGRDGFLITVAR